MLQPGASMRRDGVNLRASQCRFLERIGDIQLHEGEPFFIVDQIAFGKGNEGTRDAEQVQDVEVLARLRHDAFIGGDDQ